MSSKGSVRRKTVKEILQDNKLLSEEQLQQALEESKKTGEPLQSLVVRLNMLSRVDLLRTLSQEWGVKAVNLDEIEIDPETVKAIPEAAARRHRAVPFVKEENILFVAMSDPRDFFVIEDIQLRTNFEVQAYLTLPEDINKVLDKAYGLAESVSVEQMMSGITEASAGEDVKLEKVEAKVEVTEVDASAPEVEKLVNAIIL